MNTRLLLACFSVITACGASSASADDKSAPSPTVNPTTVYRQQMPDGRIVYSDKALKGGKVDHTITVAPPIKGNLWTTESVLNPAAPQQTESLKINKVDVIPPLGKSKSVDEATSDVIRAEMLWEDARKRQEKGVEPLPGERTGNKDDSSRLNDTYYARQQRLAQDVIDAKAALKKATEVRDALRNVRN